MDRVRVWVMDRVVMDRVRVWHTSAQSNFKTCRPSPAQRDHVQRRAQPELVSLSLISLSLSLSYFYY
jgi:hypothetical protein